MQFLVSLSLVLPALAAPIASPQTEGVTTITDGITGGLLGGGNIPGLNGRKLAVRHGAAPSHGSEEEESTISVGANVKVAARSPLEEVDQLVGPVPTGDLPIQLRNAHGGPPGQKHEQEKEDDEGLITIVVDALSRRAEHGNPHGGHESDHKENEEEEEGGLVAIGANVEALNARELLGLNADVKADVDVKANVDVNVGGEDEKEPSHPPSHGPGYGPSHGPSHGSGYGGHAKTRAVSFDPECEFQDDEDCEMLIVSRDSSDSEAGLAKVAVNVGP